MQIPACMQDSAVFGCKKACTNVQAAEAFLNFFCFSVMYHFFCPAELLQDLLSFFRLKKYPFRLR